MRKPSFHLKSYPWYVSDWRMSETRLRLSPLGRYIYRELIDQCFLDGSLPNDERLLSKIADVPLRDFRREWPQVRLSFVEDGHGRLHNDKVDIVLPDLEKWHEQKRIAGQAGGKARAKRTPSERLAGAQALLKPSTSTSTSTYNPPSPTDRMCQEFISAYPEAKRQKQGAVDRWYAFNVGQHVNPEKKHAEIMAGLERAKRSAAWEKQDGKYICGMLSFLEDERWKEQWPESEGGYVTPLWTPGEDD